MRWASEAGAGNRLCFEGRAAARSERERLSQRGGKSPGTGSG